MLANTGPSPDELEEKYTVEVWDSGTEEDGHCDTVFLSISDKFLQEIDGTKGDVSTTALMCISCSPRSPGPVVMLVSKLVVPVCGCLGDRPGGPQVSTVSES